MFDVRHEREVLFQIGIPLLLNQTLIWFFSVPAVNPVDGGHATDDFSKRTELFSIEPGVVHRIEKYLRGARAPPGHGERYGPTRIAGIDGVVGNLVAPFSLDIRIPVNTELHHEVRQYAEGMATIPKFGGREFLNSRHA